MLNLKLKIFVMLTLSQLGVVFQCVRLFLLVHMGKATAGSSARAMRRRATESAANHASAACPKLTVRLRVDVIKML